jgi:tetratricopeptide (TPR) repeat protein
MSSLYRFLSGEVPGGFVIFLLILFAITFIGLFLNRYSTVMNKRVLKTIIVSLLIFVTLTYTILRAARPPKEEPVQIGVWPLEFVSSAGTMDSSAFRHYGLGWMIAEMISYQASQQTPAHVSFLRPEWMVESLDSTDRYSFSLKNENLLSWAKLIQLEYIAGGQYKISNNQYEGEIIIYEVQSQKPIKQISFSLPLLSGHTDVQPVAEDVIRFLFKEDGLTYNPAESDWSLFSSPGITDYSTGRYLLALDRIQESLPWFLKALKRDSAAALNWYGTGLAYGEMMLRAKDEKIRHDFQNRCVYHLKKAGQRSEQFEPAYIALAKYYLFIEPEPRYFDAEAALLAAHALYERDYEIYYLLSFMQKARWGLFGYNDRESLLKKSIETNPAGFYSYIELGKNLMEWARPNDYKARLAMEYFIIAKRLRPNNPSAIRGLVSGYDYVGQFDQAMELLNKHHQAYPDQSEFYYIKGILHYHIGAKLNQNKKLKEAAAEYAQAELSFKNSIQLKTNGYAYLYLGKIYDIQKRRNEAIEAYRGAMKNISKEDKFREEARKKLREYYPDVE